MVDRAARAETERCVTVRPAPDCMTYVTALLPMTQGVGVYAALKRAADTCFDGRSRGQVMADTLVERVTGRPADTAPPDRGQPGALRRHPVRAVDAPAVVSTATGRSPRWWRATWC